MMSIEHCSVCAEPIEGIVVLLECGHALCTEHFRALWSARERCVPSCPECRALWSKGVVSAASYARALDRATSDAQLAGMHAFMHWFRERARAQQQRQHRESPKPVVLTDFQLMLWGGALLMTVFIACTALALAMWAVCDIRGAVRYTDGTFVRM